MYRKNLLSRIYLFFISAQHHQIFKIPVSAPHYTQFIIEGGQAKRFWGFNFVIKYHFLHPLFIFVSLLLFDLLSAFCSLFENLKYHYWNKKVQNNQLLRSAKHQCFFLTTNSYFNWISISFYFIIFDKYNSLPALFMNPSLFLS